MVGCVRRSYVVQYVPFQKDTDVQGAGRRPQSPWGYPRIPEVRPSPRVVQRVTTPHSRATDIYFDINAVFTEDQFHSPPRCVLRSTNAA